MATEVFTRCFAHRATCVWLCVAIAVAQAGCATGLPNLRNDSAVPQTTAGATAAEGINRTDARSSEAGEPAAVSATKSAPPQELDDGSTTPAAKVAKGVVGGVLLTALIAIMFAPLLVLAMR